METTSNDLDRDALHAEFREKQKKKRKNQMKQILLICTWISFVISTITLYLSWSETHNECYSNDCITSAPLLDTNVCYWNDDGSGNPCNTVFTPNIDTTKYNATLYEDYIHLVGCDWSEHQKQAANSEQYGAEFTCYRQKTEEECLEISCNVMCQQGCDRHLMMFIFLCIISSLTQAPLFKSYDAEGCGVCTKDKTLCLCAVGFGKIAKYFTSYGVRLILVNTGMNSSGFIAIFGICMIGAMAVFICIGYCCNGCNENPLQYIFVLVKSLVYIEIFVIFIQFLATNVSFNWPNAFDFVFGFNFDIKPFTTLSVITITIKNILSISMELMSLAEYFKKDFL